MRGYDAWLEAPYERAAAMEAEYERFCEANDFDFDDPEAEVAFERWLDEEEEETYSRMAEERREYDDYDEREVYGDWD
jgi:hypothetical protein